MKDNNELNIKFNTKITVEPSAVEDYYIVSFTLTNDTRPLMYMCHIDSITWLITEITERLTVTKWLTQKNTSMV